MDVYQWVLIKGLQMTKITWALGLYAKTWAAYKIQIKKYLEMFFQRKNANYLARQPKYIYLCLSCYFS